MPKNLVYELDQISKTSAFLEASDEMQQALLRRKRDEYIAENPKDAEYAQLVAEDRNQTNRRASGKGRYIPTDLKLDAEWGSEEFDLLPKDKKLQEIEKFRARIPKIAAQDTLNFEDNEFYLNHVASAKLRDVKSADTGYLTDKGYRAFDGFVGGLISYIGAEDLAESIRLLTSDNPKYDFDSVANQDQGVGGIMIVIAIMLVGICVCGLLLKHLFGRTGKPGKGGAAPS